MESSDEVSIEKPPSLPPNYVSLAQLQQQWLQRQKEKKMAEEREQEEKRMAEERLQQEKRMAEEQLRKEKRMAEERLRKEKRMAEEQLRKENRMAEERLRKEKRIAEERQLKEKEKLLGTERSREMVQWRRVDGIHRNSEESVAEVSGNRKNGNLKKKGARVSGILIGEDKCDTRVQFGDKGFQGKVQIAAIGVCKGAAHEDSGENINGGGNRRNVRKGTAPMNGKTEGVLMEGNVRLREKTEMKSQDLDDKEMISSDSRREEDVVGEGGSVIGNGRRKKKGSLAFDDKEIISGDPSVKARRDSRFEENVVGEGGSVMVDGWRKKKIGRESQAFGDKEMVSGNLSMKTKRDLCSEGNVALRKGNAELLKTDTEEDSSISVRRKRGEGRFSNRYQRKRGNVVVSEIESGHAENVVEEGLLVGGKETQKAKTIESGHAENVVEEGLLVGKNETQKAETEKGLQAFDDKGMDSGNLSTKIRKDLVEESGEGNMSVNKGKFRGRKYKRRSRVRGIGDRDGEVEGAIGVFTLEVVPESKGKEVTLQGDTGSKEVQIPVAGKSVDQGKLEVSRERRRGERRFKVKVDSRGTLGGSRESKMELGSEENVGKNGVLVEGNEGQVEKTEMGSQTNGDADLLAGNISTNIERGLSSLSLNESSEGNVALRRKYHGWQRKKFGKPRAATVVWVKKMETSEPSIAEN